MTTRKKADPNFQMKIENKKAKFQTLSIKLKERSSQLYGEAMKKASFIPMGQPLMPDHYSYKRDRKFRDSIDNGIRKSIETDKKAEYYESKAVNYGSGNSISSSDPEAFEKLTAKIKMLENHVNNCKEANKIIRSLTTWEKFDLWLEETFKNNQTEVNKIVKDKIEYGRYKMYKIESPVRCQCSWELSNTGAEIRRLKKRLETLEKHEERENFYFKNDLVEAKEEEARINLYFQGKPSEEVRTKVKAKGFKWSPTRTAWTRQITSSTPNWFFDELPKFLEGLNNE